ncbi:MAG: acyl-[acyl-carrier-protein] thioesterase [bacterium]
MTLNAEVKRVWNDTYKIHSYEVDVKGQVTVPHLCQFMQESAWNHAEHLGVGYSHLMAKNLVWVLSRQRLRILSLPKWGDSIKIQTWPSGTDRLFCYRDFRILDAADEIVALATTAWFAIDLNSRSPQQPGSYFTLKLENLERVLPGKLNKLKSLTAPKRARVIQVGYRDLDVNEHVNNVRFVEWMLESFALDFQKTHQLQEMEINYLAEAFYGDEISVRCEEEEDLAFLHSSRNESTNTEVCRFRTVWQRAG